MSEIDRLRKNVFENLQEIERLESIIKEVREYIENEKNKIKNHQYAVGIRRLNKIEEILGKDIMEKSDCNYGKVEKENK